MNHSILFLVLLVHASTSHAQTFREITDAFPIGTHKQVIQKKEPTATLAPSSVSPITSFSTNESIILMKQADKSRLVVQFYIVDDKVAAMMLSRGAMPGVVNNRDNDLSYVRDKKTLETFSALRVDGQLNPLEVTVKKKAFDEPDTVALLVNARSGAELWIVDEKIFNPRTFFMEPTEPNRLKVLQSKRGIEAQKKAYEDLEKAK